MHICQLQKYEGLKKHMQGKNTRKAARNQKSWPLGKEDSGEKVPRDPAERAEKASSGLNTRELLEASRTKVPKVRGNKSAVKKRGKSKQRPR